MFDIIEVKDESDLVILSSPVRKAGNVLSVQLGSLEYAPEFGVDLKYFLDTDLKFQNESFRSYLVQRLTEHQITVADVETIIQVLDERFNFYVGDPGDNTEGLIL